MNRHSVQTDVSRHEQRDNAYSSPGRGLLSYVAIRRESTMTSALAAALTGSSSSADSSARAPQATSLCPVFELRIDGDGRASYPFSSRTSRVVSFDGLP